MRSLTLFLGLSVFIACNDINDCDSDSNEKFMIIRFFDAESKSAKKVGFRVTETETNTAFGLSEDSLAIGLSLNPQDTSLSFLFDSDTNDYVLNVRYDTEFTIFDPECDPSLTFLNLDTLSSSFDSTAIQGTVTNRQLTTNFEVYF